MKKKSAALVLSGGAALGAAHIGAVSVLEKHYTWDYYIGTSAGAIMAAGLACGIRPAEISKILEQKSLLTLAFDFSFSGTGIIRGKKVLNLLRQVYDDRSFSDLDTTLKVCTTNFLDGTPYIISEGSIAEAVRASVSIPGIFDPYFINDIPLVDGGLTANIPLQFAQDEYEGETIFAIDVLSFTKDPSAFTQRGINLKKVLERTVKIIFQNQIAHIPKDPRTVLIQPELNQYDSSSILKLKEIEEAGRVAALEKI